MIDSHCHLDFEIFDTYRAELLARMRAAGITGYIIPGVKADTWSRLLEVVEQDSQCALALGLHPAFMEDHRSADLLQLEQSLNHPSVVAIGEIGLNRLHHSEDLSAQKEILNQQLTLAKEQGVPVILHARQSLDELIGIVRKLGFSNGGIVHAFSGSEQQAEQWLKLGFKLGVGGAITHPRAVRLRRVVAKLSTGSIVLETDSPDMRPSFLPKNCENTPLVIPLIASVLASLRGEGWQEVVEQSDKAVLEALPRCAERFR
ncbi:TatD DNase family protein [Sinobacterium caligoides]|uniref:TatD DNase family protein n=1 Tax=Sinobacterium caligoides TaxID=933926 RepID=A0A3N2E3G1_9GAMM|nr:TatD family hydrolase [Sinobacterium caligoides]ROS06135.1 TatD DNase family protein [Sinobacterium caligoides]